MDAFEKYTVQMHLREDEVGQEVEQLWLGEVDGAHCSLFLSPGVLQMLKF